MTIGFRRVEPVAAFAGAAVVVAGGCLAGTVLALNEERRFCRSSSSSLSLVRSIAPSHCAGVGRVTLLRFLPFGCGATVAVTGITGDGSVEGATG
jgi:hypothetical protein